MMARRMSGMPPVIEYESRVGRPRPTWGDLARRVWGAPYAAAFVLACFASGYLLGSWRGRVMILPMTVGLVWYVVARVAGSRCSTWAKWNLGISGVLLALFGASFVAPDRAPINLGATYNFSLWEDLREYGWYGWGDAGSLKQLDHVIVIGGCFCTVWFVVVQVVDWVIRRRRR